MTLTAPPLTEDLKQTILDEHPDGVWIVLADEFPESVEPELAELSGHPTTVLAHAAGRSRTPR